MNDGGSFLYKLCFVMTYSYAFSVDINFEEFFKDGRNIEHANGTVPSGKLFHTPFNYHLFVPTEDKKGRATEEELKYFRENYETAQKTMKETRDTRKMIDNFPKFDEYGFLVFPKPAVPTYEPLRSRVSSEMLSLPEVKCMVDLDECIISYIGKTDKWMSPKHILTSFIHNFYVSLLEHFYKGVDKESHLQNTCTQFSNGFKQCVISAFQRKDVGEHCEEAEKVLVFVEGMIDYICNEGFDRYYKHFIEDRCMEFVLYLIDDYLECINWKFNHYPEETIQNFFIDMRERISENVTKEAISVNFHHFLCIMDSYVSCVDPQIDRICSKSARNVWVSMFYVGAFKLLNYYSIPAFIPNAEQCRFVEYQFYKDLV